MNRGAPPSVSPQQMALLQQDMKAHRAADMAAVERLYKKFLKAAPPQVE